MKKIFVLKEKNSIALLLPVMLILIITMIIFSKNEVRHIDKSLSSIYYDRLVAGRTITQVMDLLYENRILMEEYIKTDTFSTKMYAEDQLLNNYTQMDSLMSEFKKTVLVRDEAEALKLYGQKSQAYQNFQQQLFELSKNKNKASATQLYGQQEEKLFKSVLTLLRQLSIVQPRVGKELLQDSQVRIRAIQEISFLEIVFVVILCGLIAMTILHTVQRVNRKIYFVDQKYRLN